MPNALPYIIEKTAPPTTASTIPRRWLPHLIKVAEKHRMTLKEIFARTSVDRVVLARDDAWWTIHTLFKCSLPFLAARTGGWHHTSVMVGIRRHQRRMDGLPCDFRWRALTQENENEA